MKSICKFIVLVSFISLSSMAAELWVPYTATYTETQKITNRNGDVTKSTEVSGKKMRGSNGNQMLIRFKGGAQVGRFWDVNQGKVFDISYLNKRATLAQSWQPRPQPHYTRADTSTGTQVINGLLCKGFPMHKDGQSGASVGTMWVSLENDLEVKQEIDMTNPEGFRTQLGFELSDIELGKAPPPDQIGIPADFEVLDRVAARCCAGRDASAPAEHH